MAFLEIDGSAVSIRSRRDSRSLWIPAISPWWTPRAGIDIQTVRGARPVLFGGEGLFNTVTGPGRVVLQTMALPAFNDAPLIPYLPAKSDPNLTQQNG